MASLLFLMNIPPLSTIFDDNNDDDDNDNDNDNDDDTDDDTTFVFVDFFFQEAIVLFER